MTIAGVPAGAILVASYAWWGGSLSSSDPDIVVNGTPIVGTSIGTHIDKCWGVGGTENFRANVSSVITGNGTYSISCDAGAWGVDGVTLMVIYRMPSSTYIGNIRIADGCWVNNSGSTFNYTLTNPTPPACAPTGSRGFAIVSDMQNNVSASHTMTSNGVTGTFPNNFWNFDQNNITLASGQGNVGFTMAPGGGDCYNWVQAGIYYRTNCTVLTITPTITNATCSLCNGGASVAVSGGSGTYTYSWSPAPGAGQGTNTISSSCAGTYTVTVTDPTNCLQNTATVTIGNTGSSSPPVITAAGPFCVNAAAVTLSATPTGGTWSGPGITNATTGTFNPATAGAGTHTITYTTSGPCGGTSTTTIVVNPLPTITVNSATKCASAPGVTLTATGASTYSWSPATGLSATTGSSVTANPAATTTYTITGTSAAGCTSTATATVTVNPNPTVTVNNATICSGASATLTANGASTYVWSPATGLSATTGSSVTANPTATTTYTITGTSAAGCTGTATSTVTVNPNPTITVNSPSMCAGSPATLTASGASTYTWSPATGLSATTGSTVTANPAATTTYTVTGTSAAGCTGTATSTVTVNPAPVISVNSATKCASAPAVTLTATGASTYAWSPATGLSATTGSSVTANPAATTTYTITGTSAAGCTGTTTATVTVNPNPTVTVNNATICTGATATLTANGASTYVWSPATGLSATTGATVTANPSATTTYTITGTSAAGCTGTATSTVTVNPLPTVTVNSATICPGGSAILTATGASTYAWSPATGLSATTGASVTANPAATTTYTITGTSAAGCVSTATSTVTVNSTVTVTVNSATICNGASATLTASGASSYTWSPATGLSSTTGATVTANPTATTTYTVTGTSGAGCTGTATSTVTINPLPTVTVNNATICTGNAATLTANGASTYAWSPATGLSATTGTTVTANPTATTTYTVTGTSAAGCVNTANATVTVNALPTINVASTAICAGDNTNLTATGASTYAWSPATGLSATTGATVNASPAATTTYTITGTDANGCVNSTTATVTINSNSDATINPAGPFCIDAPATTITSLNPGGTWSGPGITNASTGAFNPATAGAGTHNIIYTIAGTCGDDDTIQVIVNPLPVVTVNNATICFNASTTLNAAGANTYTWSPATGLSATTGASVTANPTNTTTYTITGISAAGCVSTASSTVTVNALPTVTVNSGAICVGDVLPLTANGASTYAWGPATGLSATTGTTVNASPAVTTTYIVTGTDANGCVDTASSTVTVTTYADATINPAGPFCIDAAPSNITAVNPGGTWSGTGITNTAAGTFDPATAGAGTHNIIYTIASTCGDDDTIQIVVNALPVVTVNSDSICNGLSTTLTANGASTYAWSPATGLSATTGASVTANPSATTTYTITGTDVNGCISSANATVTVINFADASVSPAGPYCDDNSPAFLAATNPGGVWSGPGVNSATGLFDPAAAGGGTHTITYIISGFCPDTGTISILVIPRVDATIDAAGPYCLADPAVNLTAASTGGTWTGTGITSAANGTFDPSVAGVGTHTVTYTQSGVCGSTDTQQIIVTPIIAATINPAAAVCVNGTGFNFTAVNSGGTWSGPGITNANTGAFSPSAAGPGTHTITYITPGACGDTSTTTIVVNDVPAISFSADVISGCSPLTVEFTDNTNPAGTSAVWDFGDNSSSNALGTVTHTYVDPQCYDVTLTLTSAQGCTSTSTINNMICVFGNPVADFMGTPQPTTVLNPEVNFSNLSVGGFNYDWYFDNLGTSTQVNPSFTFPTDDGGTYNVCLNVTSANGCVDSICHEIVINPEFLLYVPNTFTPDGDGVNDYFMPVISGEMEEEYELMIFNRWGELIYYTEIVTKGWDGKHKDVDAKEDVYVWKIKVKSAQDGDKKAFYGHVNLLR